MINGKKYLLYLTGIVLFPAFLFFSCEEAGVKASEEDLTEEETTEEEDSVAPPENLVGTIALNNGKSAVMELQFDSTSSGARAASISVTGNIRYDGDDYVVGGLYNEGTGAIDFFAENTTNQLKFIFMGTYSVAEGFSGTVTLYSTVDDSIQAAGSVSAVAAADTEMSTIQMFTGCYGGEAAGTWNGTLTSEGFYGNYASYDGEESDSFFLNRNNNSLSGTADETTITGTVSGDTITGRWATTWIDGEDSGIARGTWNGAVVNSDGDPMEITSTLDKVFLSNMICQTYENGASLWEYAYEQGDVDFGDTYSGITLTYSEDSSYEIYTFAFADYDDVQTGLSIDGTVVASDFAGTDTLYTLIVDDDGNDDGGNMVITLPDGSTTMNLNVDLIFAEDGSYVSGSWILGGESVDVLYMFEE